MEAMTMQAPETTDQIRLELDKRAFMAALDNLPRIITAPDSDTLKNKAYFRAAFHDFFNQVLGIPASPAMLANIMNQESNDARDRILLFAMGFLTSGGIAGVVKHALPAIREKFNQSDIMEYILKELILLAFTMSKVIAPDLLISDLERKEEFARKMLAIFNIGVTGENETESKTILENLDSVEIQKLSSELEVIIRAEIQKRMAEAAEAAAKDTRE
jgi:hypothetical protein